MTLPTRKLTSAERSALELRFDGPIPQQYLGPFLDLPTDRTGLNSLLIELASEADEIRASGHMFKDVKVAVVQREMSIVREALDALPQLQIAAE